MHKVQLKVDAKHCCPDCPAPTPQQEEPCEADVALTGKLTMECCCPRLYTRTFHTQLAPQSEAALLAYLAATAAAWEAGNYLLLGHSIVDTGSGWLFGLTVGWYA
jgi:hypothetical protein